MSSTPAARYLSFRGSEPKTADLGYLTTVQGLTTAAMSNLEHREHQTIQGLVLDPARDASESLQFE